MKSKEEELKREIRRLKRDNERLEREVVEWKQRARILIREKTELQDQITNTPEL